MTVDRIINPFADRGPQPDAPHSGGLDLALARETDALAFHGCGTSRSWVYIFPGTTYQAGGFLSGECAPIAHVASAGSWVDLEAYAATAPAMFPWRFTEDHAAIEVSATLACMHEVRIGFRCQARTLVDAVATTTGSSSAYHCRESAAMALWQRSSQSSSDINRVARFTSVIYAPAVPANRRIALVPQVAVFQADYGPFRLASPGTVAVQLVDMCAIDLPDLASVGA